MRRLLLVVVLSLCSTSLSAQVVDVASGGASSLGPGTSLVSSLGAQFTVANDFVLSSPTTFRSASFFTLECCGSAWSGDLTYGFFNPGDPLLPALAPFTHGTTGDYLATTLYSDVATNVIRRIDFNFGSPITLGAGTYWFGLSATQDPGAGSLAWRSVQEPGRTSVGALGTTVTSWIPQSGDVAFALYDTSFDIPSSTTPEPVSMALLGTGLLGLAVVRRRQRRTE